MSTTPSPKKSATPSPKKKSGLFGDFTAAEIKLIMASVLCMSGKPKLTLLTIQLDTEKLGKLSNTKRHSASSRFPSIKRKLEKMFEDELSNLDDGQTNLNAKGKGPATGRAKKRRDKVVDPQPEPEHDIKSEAESGEDTKNAVKVEIVIESGESTESLVKVKADTDTDIKIKPEPID
ncbi:hypothetical protein N7516_011341 [Penicillium verrucosum]|uniref:uncharacterized protein n=1 Tax=Penicillium verrucosum TaxID=60171 RepID=UPI0025453FC4|nr:uncharacterized protein N7516_011341 [Penicillium verrucosum]KAJ5920483.1 hypothetical protein N7516_011341 [Penicillium verrucosum]